MFTLFYALVSVAITIAIVNAQTYDDCGSTTLSVGGVDQTMQLERDSANSMVKITLTGPSDKWFGFVIGRSFMDGYAITGHGATTYQLTERTLMEYSPVLELDSSGTVTADNSGSNGVLTLVRPYSFGSSGDYFDFTDIMTCKTEDISIAGAQGSSLDWAKHAATDSLRKFIKTCDCSNSIATLNPTSSPTLNPSLSPTSNPSLAPIKQPLDPTLNPSLTPTLNPTSTPSVSPVVTETDDYEICAESELITNIGLKLYRDAKNKMVKIEISGANTAWFGYGFGSAEMIGTIDACYIFQL